ncbi:MAG: FAD-binding and (Fe-S)-binding domain-containing protein [Halosimplex sp.]
MATPSDPGPDTSHAAPATSHETLGYDHPDAAEYAALAADLREAVAGEVRFDEYAQVLYATDGSIYGARPAGVVAPRDAADVRAAVEVAGEHGVPILPRGAGTSLAGQTVGPGCVVLDCSRHMDAIVDVDPEARRATVQPGVVQDDLDAHLAQFGLKFAPDPASSNRATIGGGIGNNSTGAHSVRYGITDAYVDELDVVLADGSQIRTRDVVLDSPEWNEVTAGDGLEAALYETVRAVVEDHADEIEERYPDLKRSVSGYNLQKVIREADGERVINLSKLFVGSEGTLGVVTEATLDLVTRPEETALALYAFETLADALAAVPVALEYDTSAVELMDDEVFRLARESSEYAAYAKPIPADAGAALMVEFDDECHDDLAAAVAATDERFLPDETGESAAGETDESGSAVGETDVGEGEGGPRPVAFDAVHAFDPADQDRLWKLRKAAIPLLMSLEGDPKPYPFIEDATVPPEELVEYVDAFQDVLDDHGTTAAYFAHAGVGTLHIRPILNLKGEDGVETMRSIAEDVTDLVVEREGSVSGEHGDGLARTQFNRKLYGEALWDAFREVKSAADPDWRMNPGKVVYRESDPTDIREHLRYGPEYSSVEPTTALDFSEEGGFSHLVELCNGCGTCRQTDGDVMCPTYRASEEEIQSTRGRANMLRAAISGDLPEEELFGERFQAEVLDLCVGCKGCASDCPTGVDVAKLKTEVTHEAHQRNGVGLRERLFADAERAFRLGSATAPVSNWLAALPGADRLFESVLGIAPERDLPTFARESFEAWFAERGPRVPAASAADRVLLFPDAYTNYTAPEIGKAAVRVLEAADVHVRVPDDRAPSGRPAYSKGFLDRARDRAERNVGALAGPVEQGWSVVTVEPADAVMFQDEYLDLLPDDPRAEALADAAAGVCEYLDRTRADERIDFEAPGESLAYHGHCNQQAVGADHHAVGVLRRAGYAVDPLDTSCCGMAGSFGYEAEHYDLSRAIGSRVVDAVDASDADTVVAPGASCRTQLGDLRETVGASAPDAGRDRPPHPVEKLAAALAE